ncbi:bifunctional DNA primase/polymerase [Streptomyces sp. RFCAC02]|uniref:bifunctional DNA primase/polymerase n=1 Tax=Streptomyces sp. RFCAC02 TaxID=2499143 RepID=UPI001020FF11|nr:bifunctional DNA primase/polymerase [Streptomyces sp. RFCAC02]
MGFTIGGLREIREQRLAARRPGPRPTPAGIPTAVAEYTGLRGWDVTPGARATRNARGGRAACSCGSAHCPSPGAHPLDAAFTIPAGATLDRVCGDWVPGASVLLPTGRRFDILDAPAHAARRALPRLERLGLRTGPVALAPHGRAWFFVAPGSTAELPVLLRRLGWGDTPVDLRGLGPGRHITAPPSDHGGHGPVRWLRAPGLETPATPPPVTRTLLAALAYNCASLPCLALHP